MQQAIALNIVIGLAKGNVLPKRYCDGCESLESQRKEQLEAISIIETDLNKECAVPLPGIPIYLRDTEKLIDHTNDIFEWIYFHPEYALHHEDMGRWYVALSDGDD